MLAALSPTRQFSMQSMVSILLVFSLFTLPLSSTAKSIFLSLSVIAILLTSNYREKIKNQLEKTWCKMALLLFVIALLACLWSPAPYSERLYVMEKYSKLLYLPLLVLGFQDEKTRTVGLHAFLAAMLITSIIAVLKFHGFLTFLNVNPDNLFRNHIIAGYMLDFAAYASALFAYRQSGLKRLGYLLLFCLYSYYVLFVNGGRMGYLVYFISLFLLILQLFRLQQAALVILLVCGSSLILYSQNPFMKERMQLLKTQYESYQNKKGDNSVGFRLKFHHYAYTLFKKHPFIGNGTSSFFYHFHNDDPVPGWGWHRNLREPHSQYWYIASEFGLLGFVTLLLLLYSLIKESFRLDTMRPLAFAIILSFILGNLTDSLLLYSGSGYFVILIMALCLGEQNPPTLYEPRIKG